MPAGFDKCRKQGGKIRTVKLKGGRYQHVCYLDGKPYKGEVKKKQQAGSTAAAIRERMG